MGTKYHPRVVTNGLIFYLDAGNTRSYSGSGLTANGLVAGLGGTLVNGTGFSSANSGSFFFDGTNDYLNVGNSNSIQLTTGTYCVWCRTNGPGSGFRGIFAKQYAVGIFYNSSGLTVYDWSIPRSNDTGINLADNTWKYIAFSFQSGVANGTVLYLNGSGILTTTYTISNNLNNLFLGSEQNANQNALCNISQAKVYNRVLSAQEILQNYNATKMRYL
jgi:hypothetical protein